MERSILHINIAGFHTAVAKAVNPSLRSYPVVVAGKRRAEVIDFSPRLSETGIFRGMPVSAARRRCPDIMVIDPVFRACENAQKRLAFEAGFYSPLVESSDGGHVFVDLTGTGRLMGQPRDCAYRLKKEIKSKYSLPAAAGIGQNKLVSKIAARVIKPEGFCGVINGCEEGFIGPLPLNLLPGIDSDTMLSLRRFNFVRINDITESGPEYLSRAIGSTAYDICNLARGIDSAPVRRPDQKPPAITEEEVFDIQTNDDFVIKNALFRAAGRAGTRLRKQGFAASQAVISVMYSDGMRYSRKVRFSSPVNGDLSLYGNLVKFLDLLITRRVRLLKLEVIFSRLGYPHGQLDLFEQNTKEDEIMNAIDRLRDKFGYNVLDFYGRKR